jgi:hypothetical protein
MPVPCGDDLPVRIWHLYTNVYFNSEENVFVIFSISIMALIKAK